MRRHAREQLRREDGDPCLLRVGVEAERIAHVLLLVRKLDRGGSRVGCERGIALLHRLRAGGGLLRAAGGEREQEQSAEQQRGELFHRAASMQNDLLIPMPRARRLCPPAAEKSCPLARSVP